MSEGRASVSDQVPSRPDPIVELAVANLHDAFPNASLQRSCVERAPIAEGLVAHDLSDRVRFERTWVMFLAVLVESWKSPGLSAARALIEGCVSTADLNALIERPENRSHMTQMREVRHYMCHRDERAYWDDGRKAVFAQLEFHRQLHDALDAVLGGAMRAIVARRRAAPGTSAS